MIEDDFRDDNDKLVEFGMGLDEFNQRKYRSIVGILESYQIRIDALRAELDYTKAQVSRRQAAEEAMAHGLVEARNNLNKLEGKFWVRFLKLLRLL